MEYVSLAKTRLADLKVKIHGVGPLLNRSCVFFSHLCACVQEPVEDMGLYEDVSGEGAASLQVTAAARPRRFNDVRVFFNWHRMMYFSCCFVDI